MKIKTKCEFFTHQEKVISYKKNDKLEKPGVRINRFLLYFY